MESPTKTAYMRGGDLRPRRRMHLGRLHCRVSSGRADEPDAVGYWNRHEAGHNGRKRDERGTPCRRQEG